MDITTIEEYYDKYGHIYHEERTKKGKLFNEYIEMPAVLKLIESKNFGKSAMDVGCGSGIYTKYLSKNGFNVTGIDVSNEMLIIAKEYCKNNEAKFIHTSFENFETAENFDLILGSFILGYFDDLKLLFSKMNSMLQVSGKIIVSGVHPVRMSAKERSLEGYYINDYFSSSLYETIIAEGEEMLQIRKHTIEDIAESAYECGLCIERVIEPKPIDKLQNKKELSFYLKCPSVIIFQLTQKK